MEMQPAEMPRFVSHAFIRIELEREGPGGRRVSKVLGRGDGGFLFIRKRFRTTTTFACAAAP